MDAHPMDHDGEAKGPNAHDLDAAIARVRRDDEFQAALKRVLEAQREVLDRLART